MNTAAQVWRTRLAVPAAALALAAALAFVVHKSVLSHEPEVDFRFIWTAGHLWAIGIDPYGPAYTPAGARLFPDGNAIAYWLYPPQWWGIARPLADLSPGHALLLWRTLNALLLVGGAGFLAGAPGARGRLPTWGLLLAIALPCCLAATPQTLSMGQTSILVFAGFCLVGGGLRRGNAAAVGAGLFLLLLKPQFGAAALAFLVADRRWWPVIAATLAASLVLALPQLLAFGIGETVHGFLGNLKLHATLEPNQPEKLTGLTQLAVRSVGWKLGAASTSGLAALASLAAGWRRARGGSADAALLGLVAACVFLVPLHDYDFVAVAAVAPLLPGLPRPARWLSLAAMALAIRPAKLAELAGWGSAGGEVALLTVVALLLVAAALLARAYSPGAANDR